MGATQARPGGRRGEWRSTPSACRISGRRAGLIEPRRSHRVAWLDLLGGRPGRGVVTRADLLDRRLGRDAGKATMSARADGCTPEAVARPTVEALSGRAHTVRAPGVLLYVFAPVRHLPRTVFRKIPR